MFNCALRNIFRVARLPLSQRGTSVRERGQGGEVSAFLLIALLVTLFAHPAQAQPPLTTPHVTTTPKTLVFLTDGLSYDDLRPNGPLRDVRILADAGSVALLNPAVGGQATQAAAFLSIGSGEHMSAPGKFGPKLYESGIERSVSDVAAEAYTVLPDTADPTRMTYIRRMGVAPPTDAKILAVGLPVLQQVQATPRVAQQIGALGEMLRRAGKRVAIYGDWPAVLVGMDVQGSAPAGQTSAELSPHALAGTLQDGDVIVVSVSGRTPLKFLARAVAPLARHGLVNVLVVDAAPPRTADGRTWSRLGWVIGAGPAFPAGTVLTSPTTRTPGLIANVDLAPTILALAGAGNTLPGGVGRAATVEETRRGAWNVLGRLDRLTVAITKTVVPLMATFAAIGIGSGLLALLGLYFRLDVFGKLAWVGLLVAAGMFVALLVMGLIAPQSIRVYVVGAVGVAAVVAAMAVGVGRAVNLPPMGVLFGFLAVVLLIDSFCGGYCVQRSINNFLPGIRYYGIGNEYLGAAIGACLVAVGLLRPPRIVAYAMFALLTLAVGWPTFGANSGGALTATVAFVVAGAAIARGGRVRPLTVVVAFVAGIALTVALAFLDSHLSPDVRSHAGAVVAAGETQGAGLWAEIAFRKLAMNLRLALDHKTLIGMAAVGPLWWFLATGKLGDMARASVAARPALARMLPACGWATVAALCFKDSGVVTALILLACPTAAILAAMLEDAGYGFFAGREIKD